MPPAAASARGRTCAPPLHAAACWEAAAPPGRAAAPCHSVIQLYDDLARAPGRRPPHGRPPACACMAAAVLQRGRPPPARRRHAPARAAAVRRAAPCRARLGGASGPCSGAAVLQRGRPPQAAGRLHVRPASARACSFNEGPTHGRRRPPPASRAQGLRACGILHVRRAAARRPSTRAQRMPAAAAGGGPAARARRLCTRPHAGRRPRRQGAPPRPVILSYSCMTILHVRRAGGRRTGGRRHAPAWPPPSFNEGGRRRPAAAMRLHVRRPSGARPHVAPD